MSQSAAVTGRVDPLAGLPRTVAWSREGGGRVEILDQTLLPLERRVVCCERVEQVWEAIRRLRVRGAPAIGVAAAFGMCVGTREARSGSTQAFLERVAEVRTYLDSARPTAVNLAWATRRVAEGARRMEGGSAQRWEAMLEEAHAISREDAAMCRRIGEVGAELIPDGARVLTHCNAGVLATAGLGTALAAIYVAHEQGRRVRVYADETRPLLQGARLTAYELSAAGIDVRVLCDGAAAWLMRRGEVDLVIVGADRIAANGDSANKIGTYGVAVAARQHGIPFYVAAPSSTFDLSLASGEAIPIEERGAEELRELGGRRLICEGAGVWNPAFDVTPVSFIAGIVTERGLLKPLTAENIAGFFC